MYFDLCLRVWSFFAQAPVDVNVAASPSAAPATSGFDFSSMGILRWLLMSVYLLVCFGLIVVVLNKNTKNDGLAGMLGGGGGAAQSSYHGKLSFEDRLDMASNYLAVSFIVLSMLVSVVMR